MPVGAGAAVVEVFVVVVEDFVVVVVDFVVVVFEVVFGVVVAEPAKHCE